MARSRVDAPIGPMCATVPPNPSPDRAAAVAAEGDRRDARRHRDRRARRAATRHVIGIDGVAGKRALGVHAERRHAVLGHHRVSQHDGTGLAQPAHHGRVLHVGGAGLGHAEATAVPLEIDLFLHRHEDAFEARARLALAEPTSRRLGLAQRAVLVDVEHRSHRGALLPEAMRGRDGAGGRIERRQIAGLVRRAEHRRGGRVLAGGLGHRKVLAGPGMAAARLGGPRVQRHRRARRGGERQRLRDAQIGPHQRPHHPPERARVGGADDGAERSTREARRRGELHVESEDRRRTRSSSTHSVPD
jgi:hypothetical protein